MEAAGALRAAAPILESISNPPGGASWSWVGCGCHKVPILDQIRILLSSAQAGAPTVWLKGVQPPLDVRQNPSRDTHFPSSGRRPPNQTKPNQ